MPERLEHLSQLTSFDYHVSHGLLRVPDAIGRRSSAYLTGESRFQVLQLRFEIRDGAMKFDAEMFGLKTTRFVFRL